MIEQNKSRRGINWKVKRNPELVPKNRAENFAEYRSEAWMLFARRMQKNPYMQSFVTQRDSNKCQWCGKRCLKPGQLHHVDYEHVCSFGKTIGISRPTEKRPNATRIVPDCESCSKFNPEWFAGCAARVVLVHGICNAAIDAFTPSKMTQGVAKEQSGNASTKERWLTRLRKAVLQAFSFFNLW